MARVLVVDDERGMRVTLAEFLTSDGHDVITCADSIEAEKVLSENEIDVVVSDVCLPKSSGVELLKKIKLMFSDIQVIMMTGDPTVVSASDVIKAGAFDYLEKPFVGDELCKIVQDAYKMKELNSKSSKLLAK